jgi:hypothetical protein
MPMTKQFSLHAQVLLFTDQMVGGGVGNGMILIIKLFIFLIKDPRKQINI